MRSTVPPDPFERAHNDMMPDESVDRLLQQAREGDHAAVDRLFPLIHAELHRLARNKLAMHPTGHTLQPTALVNEAYIKLCRHHDKSWEDRVHFLKVASAAMRTILLDHARARAARKRTAGGRRVDLDELVVDYDRRSHGLVALDEALERLQQRNPAMGQLVELRFFGGQTIENAARVLDISPRRANRWWQMARAWLRSQVDADRCP